MPATSVNDRTWSINDRISPPFLKPQPAPLAEAVYRWLVSVITAGGLPPGSFVPSERVLMKQFRAGRSTVRDALRALELDRVIESLPGTDVYVRTTLDCNLSDYRSLATTVEHESIVHLTEVRELMEQGAASLAAERHMANDIKEITKALDGMHEAARNDDVEAFSVADLAFHTAVAAATHNPVVMSMHRALAAQLMRSFRRSNSDVSTLRASSARHQQNPRTDSFR